MKKIHARCSDAFTLIEMIVVIVIMGLFMAVAVPAYMKWQTWASQRATVASLSAIKQAIDGYHLELNAYPSKLEDLVTKPTGEDE